MKASHFAPQHHWGGWPEDIDDVPHARAAHRGEESPDGPLRRGGAEPGDRALEAADRPPVAGPADRPGRVEVGSALVGLLTAAVVGITLAALLAVARTALGLA